MVTKSLNMCGDFQVTLHPPPPPPIAYIFWCPWLILHVLYITVLDVMTFYVMTWHDEESIMHTILTSVYNEVEWIHILGCILHGSRVQWYTWIVTTPEQGTTSGGSWLEVHHRWSSWAWWVYWSMIWLIIGCHMFRLQNHKFCNFSYIKPDNVYTWYAPFDLLNYIYTPPPLQ